MTEKQTPEEELNEYESEFKSKFADFSDKTKAEFKEKKVEAQNLLKKLQDYSKRVGKDISGMASRDKEIIEKRIETMKTKLKEFT